MLTAAFTLVNRPLSTSPSSVTFSEDGQIALCYSNDIHIVTPAIGQIYEKHKIAITGAPLGKTTLAGDPLQLLRTPLVAQQTVRWERYTTDPRLVTPGQPQARWRAVCWSPTNLSALGTSLLVGVTFNYEVIIYVPSSDPLSGEWQQLESLAVTLEDLLLQETDGDIRVASTISTGSLTAHQGLSVRVNQAQTTCASWSLSLWHAYTQDRSVLAVGHRSGHVSLWRLAEYGMQLLSRELVSSSPVALLAWSPWLIDAVTGTSKLAVTDSMGTVYILHIRVRLATTDAARAVARLPPQLVVPADRRPASQLRWIGFGSETTLVFTKIGSVGFLQPSGQLHELELEPVADYPGSSPWSSASSILTLHQDRTIVVTLTDGSFHVISLVSPDAPPALVYGAERPGSSQLLTSEARELFRKLDHARIVKYPKFAAFMSTLGATVIGDRIFWLYNTVFAKAIVHGQESKTATTAVLARLPLTEPSSPLACLETALNAPSSPLASSPLRHLMAACLDVRSMTDRDDALPQILQLLEPPAPVVEQPIPSDGDLTSRLATALFASPYLQLLRLRFFIAQYMTELLPEVDAFKEVHARLMRELAREVITRLFTVCEPDATSEGDVMLVGRLKAASAGLARPPPCPLSTQTTPLVDIDPNPAAESCPACSRPVRLTDARFASCETGHTWERCSITLAILGPIAARSCLTCRRKVRRLPPPDQRGEGSSMTESIVSIAKCCPYCGGRRSQASS